MGCGVVGGGVAEALLDRNPPWRSVSGEAGPRLELVRVADVKWPKGGRVGRAVIPARMRSTADEIIDDPSIDVVVELVGGTGFAFTVIDRALRAGKDVVTANKALLAERGATLFRTAAKAGREIAFEAAVAGGIPILSAVRGSLAANRIDTIYGILNGTTNFILTRMAETGASFADALAEAQKLGFAEADPTLDVDGIDAGHKIQLLAALALGRSVPMKRIPMQGIRSVDSIDVAYAEQLGCRIKLVATARMLASGIEIGVAPTLVARAHPLASVANEINAVFVGGTLVGSVLFVGRGAGRYPTASAVLSDLVELASGGARRYVSKMLEAHAVAPAPADEYRSEYYLRISAVDRPGVLARVTGILGREGISIKSCVQLERQDPAAPVPVALLTHVTTLARIRRAAAQIDRLPVIKAPTVRFAVIS